MKMKKDNFKRILQIMMICVVSFGLTVTSGALGSLVFIIGIVLWTANFTADVIMKLYEKGIFKFNTDFMKPKEKENEDDWN